MEIKILLMYIQKARKTMLMHTQQFMPFCFAIQAKKTVHIFYTVTWWKHVYWSLAGAAVNICGFLRTVHLGLWYPTLVQTNPYYVPICHPLPTERHNGQTEEVVNPISPPDLTRFPAVLMRVTSECVWS